MFRLRHAVKVSMVQTALPVQVDFSHLAQDMDRYAPPSEHLVEPEFLWVKEADVFCSVFGRDQRKWILHLWGKLQRFSLSVLFLVQQIWSELRHK